MQYGLFAKDINFIKVSAENVARTMLIILKMKHIYHYYSYIVLTVYVLVVTRGYALTRIYHGFL